MACFHPLTAYKVPTEKTPNGKSTIYFNKKDLTNKAYWPIKLPCKQCLGCRIDKSKEWAVRSVHESSLYQNNCFVTLTYNTKNLPKNGSLVKKDVQDFLKRLRKTFRGMQPVIREEGVTYPIRYFMCGEYGTKMKRPHYHLCIFNFDFPDKEIWDEREGVKLYRSKILEQLWTKGFSTVGEVTYQSAAYVARYVIKKINGKRKESHYTKKITCDKETGEVLTWDKLQPEYISMSLKPGIGFDWFKNFSEDVYPKDFITINGSKFKPPGYYDHLYDLEDEESMDLIRKRRRALAQTRPEEKTPERLRARKECLKRRTEKLIRTIEND